MADITDSYDMQINFICWDPELEQTHAANKDNPNYNALYNQVESIKKGIYHGSLPKEKTKKFAMYMRGDTLRFKDLATSKEYASLEELKGSVQKSKRLRICFDGHGAADADGLCGDPVKGVKGYLPAETEKVSNERMAKIVRELTSDSNETIHVVAAGCNYDNKRALKQRGVATTNLERLFDFMGPALKSKVSIFGAAYHEEENYILNPSARDPLTGEIDEAIERGLLSMASDKRVGGIWKSASARNIIFGYKNNTEKVVTAKVAKESLGSTKDAITLKKNMLQAAEEVLKSHHKKDDFIKELAVNPKSFTVENLQRFLQDKGVGVSKDMSWKKYEEEQVRVRELGVDRIVAKIRKEVSKKDFLKAAQHILLLVRGGNKKEANKLLAELAELKKRDEDGEFKELLLFINYAVFFDEKFYVASQDKDIFVSWLASFKDGYTPLHALCNQGETDQQIQAITKMLEKGVDVNLQDARGNTLLHYACRIGNARVLAKLWKGKAKQLQNENGYTPLLVLLDNRYKDLAIDMLRNGNVTREDLNKKNKLGKTALHQACSLGWADVVGELLKKGGVKQLQDERGFTPLHVLLEKGHRGLAIDMIKNGSITKEELNIKNRNGETILHQACHLGWADVVEEILKKGADPNIQDSQDMTALHWACKKNQGEIVEKFLQGGGVKQLPNKYGYTPLHLLLDIKNKELAIKVIKNSAKEDLNKQDPHGQTILDKACFLNWPDVVEEALKKGADPNIQDAKGMTPLHYACFSGRKEVIDRLCKLGAKQLQDKEGYTPLHILLGKRHKDLAIAVLKNSKITSAELNVKNKYGKTILHQACELGWDDVVEAALKKGADPNVQDSQGITPLHYACEQGWGKVIEKLCKSGVRQLQDKQDYTPLHILLERRYRDLAVYVLKNSKITPAELNMKNRNGETILHQACRLGWSDIVKEALEKGIDPDIPDIQGMTALHHVCNSRGTDKEIIPLLLKGGANKEAKDDRGNQPYRYSPYRDPRDYQPFLKWFDSEVQKAQAEAARSKAKLAKRRRDEAEHPEVEEAKRRKIEEEHRKAEEWKRREAEALRRRDEEGKRRRDEEGKRRRDEEEKLRKTEAAERRETEEAERRKAEAKHQRDDETESPLTKRSKKAVGRHEDEAIPKSPMVKKKRDRSLITYTKKRPKVKKGDSDEIASAHKLPTSLQQMQLLQEQGAPLLREDDELGLSSASDMTIEEVKEGLEGKLKYIDQEYSTAWVAEGATESGFNVTQQGDVLLQIKKKDEQLVLSGKKDEALKQYEIMNELIEVYKEKNEDELPVYTLPVDSCNASVAGMVVAAIEKGVQITTNAGELITEENIDELEIILENLPKGESSSHYPSYLQRAAMEPDSLITEYLTKLQLDPSSIKLDF